MPKQITITEKPEAEDVQSITFTKEPGQPIVCSVSIGTDQPGLGERLYASFPLSDVTGGPSVASLKAVRDHALAVLGLV